MLFFWVETGMVPLAAILQVTGLFIQDVVVILRSYLVLLSYSPESMVTHFVILSCF